MKSIYFRATKHTLQRITDLYDFVWPTAVAIWNLRWQVAGYVTTRSNASVQELLGRFSAGSGIHGANLRRASIEHSWEQQQEYFARFLLVNLIAIYEGWIEDVSDRIEPNARLARSLRQQLQFPTGGMFDNKGHLTKDPHKGVWTAIHQMTTPESR